MRSVLVVLAAVAATVVAGGPAAAQSVQKFPQANQARMQRLSAGLADANREAKTYIVQMRADPAITYAGGVAGFAKTAPAKGERYDARSSQSQMYTEHLRSQQDAALARVGASGRKIYSYRHAMNGFAARLTAIEAARLRKDKSVLRVWEDQKFQLETNNTPTFLGLNNKAKGLWAKRGLTGKGVIIGMIDSGAVQEHPSFDDTDMQPPPAHWAGICQPGEGWAETDCNNKLIGARWFADGFLAGEAMDPDDFLSPRDSDGHGTHTATTAAGRRVKASLAGTPLAMVSGMAPKAWLAIYKPCFEDADLDAPEGASCFFSDSAAATDAAVADGVDILSFSVGTAQTFADPQDIAFLFAVDAGVFVSRSAGNAGPAPSTTNAGEPWVTTVAASTHNGKAFANATTVNSPASVAGDYPSLEGATTEPLAITGPITDDLVAANPLDACAPIGAIGGKIALIIRGTCAFDVKLQNAVDAGARAVLMYTNLLGPGVENPKTVMGGAGDFPIPGVMIDNAPGAAIEAVLAGGQAVNVTLSAGKFVTEQLTGKIMAGFSSRGPYLTEPDWIKPDVTAPGVSILAGATPEPNDGGIGDFFQYLQGTSMSTPHVSGIAALILQKHPDWSPAQVKSALMTTARQRGVIKEDGSALADPFDLGSGHIIPNNAINPGLTYDAGFLDYLAASCGSPVPLVSGGDCTTLEGLGFSLDPANLNLPSIGVGEVIGSKTVYRTVTNVGPFGVYQASVKAPPGFKVVVSPKKMKLQRGESRTFAVTITNMSAPSGEWRFGELRWKDGKGHHVHSPIAVRAQAFVAPDAISGEGAEGMTSFDVGFGYAGAYNAGAHGLNDAFIAFAAGIPDDPNNTQDGGPGEPVYFVPPVPAGTAYAQWSMFDRYTNGAHDFDLYLVYCPPNLADPCVLADQSLNATSDEQVSVAFPIPDDPASPDDFYAVILHAFNTEGGNPADILFYAWDAIGPDAGNMMLTAPGSATLGGTGTVDVSWSGLNSGPGWLYAGGISHNDASGPIDLTSVNIAADGGAGFCDLIACGP